MQRMNVTLDERRSADEMILTATIGSSMGDICESEGGSAILLEQGCSQVADACQQYDSSSLSLTSEAEVRVTSINPKQS